MKTGRKLWIFAEDRDVSREKSWENRLNPIDIQIHKDIYCPDFRDFTETGECPKTTHTLDMAEGCHAADRYMFRTGEGSTGWGGIPGNNDSGGLSGCYIWNCLGLFPVSGQNLVLIGSPKFARTTLQLANGKNW